MAVQPAPGATMILVVHDTNADAVRRGYEPWLRETDCPFFNAIPGVAYYANWKVDAQAPFAYFAFMVLDAPDSLPDVWFDPDVDRFRNERIRLWGCREAPLAMHRYGHVTRTARANVGIERDSGWLSLGCGAVAAELPTAFTVEGSLATPFAGSDEPRLAPVTTRDPFGFDWVGFSRERPAAGDLVLPCHAVARP